MSVTRAQLVSNVIGVSTFPSSPVIIGTGTSTGTANQPLQVTGGACFVGTGVSVGIGTTNPPYRLTVTASGASPTPSLSYCIADLTNNINGYSQVNLRNASTSSSASGDLVITTDNGTDTTNYIDLGINNSGFSDPNWTVNGALDGYLYSSNQNFSIGVAFTNRYLSFFAGGTLAANEKMRVNETGVGIGTTNPLSTLQVGTAVSVYGSTGIISATKYYGDGSSLTGVSAGIGTEALVASGIVTTLNLTKQDHKVTATGITTITVSGGTEGDSHTVRIVNSGIATVGFSTYFLFPSGSPPVLPTTSGAISLLSFTVHRVGTAGTQLLAGASLNFS